MLGAAAGDFLAEGEEPLGRIRAGTVMISRGGSSIVIAGLVISAGVQPDLGPLATAYVLLTAILGPLVTRFAEPLARRLLDSRASRSAAPPTLAR